LGNELAKRRVVVELFVAISGGAAVLFGAIRGGILVFFGANRGGGLEFDDNLRLGSASKYKNKIVPEMIQVLSDFFFNNNHY
jgi:hypothetical protein